ncbi:uncharacterized protein [Coffea arabica]|uniref:Uncharacterized protein isoform X3 n=1 Tax=Coffea arabica TaxID=13443 RepID=A0ABM4VG53_COFAR
MRKWKSYVVNYEKLADFKGELIAQFEARMRASTCDLASLQRREMNAAKQSQISDSLEVGDRMNREVGTNDAEINKCEMNKKVSSIADILRRKGAGLLANDLLEGTNRIHFAALDLMVHWKHADWEI